MVVREILYPWRQRCGPRLTLAEVRYEVGTGAPDTVRVRIEGREDVEQVSDVRVLQSDPPRFAEPGLVRFEVTQSLEPTEVVILVGDVLGSRGPTNNREGAPMKWWLRYVKERAQNLSKMPFLSEIEGNNQSGSFSSTPCGKKATTPMTAPALGSRFRNVGEASRSRTVASRLSLYLIRLEHLCTVYAPLHG